MTTSNLTPCRTCGKDVATTAKQCPSCGENQPGVDMAKRKKINKRIFLALLGIFAFAVVVSALVPSQPNKEVQLPSLDRLQPESKLLLTSTWPQIVAAMPGLKKYGNDLKVVEISETMLDFKRPIDEYNDHLTVVIQVPDGKSGIPSDYRAWGHKCYIDIYPAEKRFRTTKTACKSVLMDRIVEDDRTGKPLVLSLQ